MAKAVRVHQVGGPEAHIYESIDLPPPGSGEVHIRQHAVGLNFIDVYYRTGLYKAPSLPFVAGNEAAGEVVSVGPGVTEFHPGDRVAYYANLGGYATERNIAADKLVRLPDHITYEQGAVLMLKGLTVWYLLHKTFKVEPGHRVLIHAAAGGIGLIACQWAKALGANVIGTVGSKAKADLALAELNNHGSLFATRPKLNDYVAKRADLIEGADTLFAAVISGKLHLPINHAYALKDAAQAHIDLESRKTTGASILKP
ncbi:MAG: quinone oxidoreductase [Rhizobiales bacterium]|nr:quinone oxidoreductase [Hyphomicrobiales bacterium]